MKSKILFSILSVLLFVFLYIPASYPANPTFNLILASDSWDMHMVYEVDVIILSTDTAPIELAAISLGFTVNNNALNGGTLTASFVPSSSQLTNTTQIPTSFNTTTVIGTGNNALRVIKIAGKTPPGTGNGSLLSNVAPGTKIARLRLTNSVDWVITSPNNIDTSMHSTYNWSLNAYVGGINTNINSSGTFIKNLNSGLLPVELTSFLSNVNGRDINLSWETKTEVNAKQFEIERSLVGAKDASITWESVGSVQASGTSTTPKKYTFVEKNLQAGKYQFRIKTIDNDGSFKLSDVIESDITLPKNFELSQNYPNPFNPSTRIDYSLPFDSKVTLDVYNITGERIGQVVNQEQSAGYYTVNFSSSALNRSVASGVYIYKINAVDNATGKSFTSIKKMMLLK
ncbi:MAG: T9SS type A sorting domain-containing protein [Ignavibacteriaceae bacterium]|nr:T9SS type A sorting domain-containing protein [Ignavibacteriaceae bacterium]